MRLLGLLGLISCLGCASLTATSKQQALAAVAASDVAADELATRWAGFVDRRISECTVPANDTPDKREACMGAAADGEQLDAALSVLLVAQRAVRLAIACGDDPLGMERECHSLRGDSQWRALGMAVMDAWDKLRPYMAAARDER